MWYGFGANPTSTTPTPRKVLLMITCQVTIQLITLKSAEFLTRTLHLATLMVLRDLESGALKHVK